MCGANVLVPARVLTAGCRGGDRNYLDAVYAKFPNQANGGKPYEWNWWAHGPTNLEVPYQTDSQTCGVFMAQFINFVSAGKTEFDFSMHTMPFVRRRMTVELMRKMLFSVG